MPLLVSRRHIYISLPFHWYYLLVSFIANVHIVVQCCNLNACCICHVHNVFLSLFKITLSSMFDKHVLHSEKSLTRSMLFYSRNCWEQNWAQFCTVYKQWLAISGCHCGLITAVKSQDTIPYFSYRSYCF